MPSPAPPTASAVDLDRSCRWPLLLLFVAAAKWFVLASGLGFVASLKCHAPEFLANVPWLTYGRIQPAASNALTFGFGIQAGLAAALWLLVRLGAVRLMLPGAVIAGTCLWNLGLVIGLVGILAGDSTGHEGLEIPGYAIPILWLAYALIALGALGTFRRRIVAELYPSHWFLLAALFWFPWIYSTAGLLLAGSPVRGIFQSVVAWWFAAQLAWIWFGFIGLAILWYLVPRVAGRELFSRYHALMAFWLLVLFSGWRGIPQSAPLPAWMPGLSTVASVLSIVPLLAIGLNLHWTLAGCYGAAWQSREGRLALIAAVACVLAGLLAILGAQPNVARVTEFTFFGPGVSRLWFLGFFAVASFAVLYESVPRLLDGILPSAVLARTHLGCTLLGILFQTVPGIAWGIVHGRAMNDVDVVFLDALKPGLMALRLGTLGDVLLLVGGTALMANFFLGGMRLCRTCCVPVVAAVLREEASEAAR